MGIKIPLSDMDYGLEEERAVLSVIRSRWLTMGEVTQEFERSFADFIGVKHAFAVSNGTVALHLANLVLGIGPGDEVIVPSLTFVATANAVLHTGADVRFADIIGDQDLNISPQAIEDEITERTKAVAVVHYGGYPCRMQEINEIVQRHNLALIEDAAHAPGASLAGQFMGTWGDVGCFSFFSNKNMATGEGGMVVTNRDDLAEIIKNLRSHAMTTLTLERHRGHAFSYDVNALGYNYRIDEIHSALGLAQLRKLQANNSKRAALTRYYRDQLRQSGLSDFVIPFEDIQGKSTCHILPVILPEHVNRQAFMKNMRQSGIQTSIHYPPIHQFTYYRQRYIGVSLPTTEEIAAREVTLPLYPKMNEGDIDFVVESIKETLALTEAGVVQ
jgi:dTDP-4-amino-4,6-dideoxygalactose transaminase